MSEKLKLIVLSGLPGAGKSTKARQLSKEFEALVVSRDDLRKNFTFIFEDELTIRLIQFAASFLRNRISIIIDAWNLHPVDRQLWTALATEANAQLRWIHLDVPVDECVKRDAKRRAPNGENSVRFAAANYEKQLTRLSREGGQWPTT